MADQNSIPPAEKQPAGEEKLQYLNRDEIRTMDRDVSSLREKEALVERDRIAKIRAQEEIKKEAQKEQEAQKEATERITSVEKERVKEEEMKKAKIELEKAKEIALIREKETIEEKKDALKKSMEGIQSKEDEERKKFIERVEAKATEKDSQTPLQAKKHLDAVSPSVPSIEKTVPQVKKEVEIKDVKPSSKKMWVRIAISILVLIILGIIAAFCYWYFVVRDSNVEEPQQNQEETAPIINEEEIENPIEEEPAEESEETLQPYELEINQMILDFGYSIPQTPRTIDTIIIHTVYNAIGGDIYSLDKVIEEYEMYGVTAHYLIDRQGTIYQTAPNEAVAYHAGKSEMPDGRTGVNDFSIGIEVINSEEDELTEVQYQSLAALVNSLKEEYNVPISNILGHKDIAPDRKTDPWNFDWQYFNGLLE